VLLACGWLRKQPGRACVLSHGLHTSANSACASTAPRNGNKHEHVMKQPTSPAHPCSGTSTAWRGRPCRMTCVAACHPFARKKGTSMNTYLPSQAAHILMHQLSCMHRVHGAGLVQTGHAHITPCTKCSGTASLDQLSPTPDITQQQNQQAQACHYPLCNATLHMQPLR
jgi:hypothetical protein